MENIVLCAFQAWTPQMGDPTVWGWLTVVVYVLAAIVAGLTARKAPFPNHTRLREKVFWGCLSAGLAFLAFNKQLDLQTLAAALGRCTALAQGWYEERRVLQVVVILGLGLFAILFGVYFLVLLRGTMRRSLLPILGGGFVCSFVMIRAVGFHHIDTLVGTRLPAAFGSVKVNFLLEAPGPLLIIFAGLWLLRRGTREDQFAD